MPSKKASSAQRPADASALKALVTTKMVPPRSAGREVAREALLARLMEQALQRGDAKRVAEWIANARWSRGRDVDAVLAQLANHADADLRNMVVEAIGWRLRKRQSSAEPLLFSALRVAL